jgi:hypothetical protein
MTIGIAFAAGCQSAQQQKVQAQMARSTQAVHNELVRESSIELYYLGDQYPQQQKPDRVNPDPIVVDDAMAARQWPQMRAIYPNFSSTAGDAQMALVVRDDLPPALHAAIENALFPFDVLFIPASMVNHHPYDQVEATSFYLPPTYTANPPLVPERPNDFSGGPGTGYNAAPGRAVDSTKMAPVP